MRKNLLVPLAVSLLFLGPAYGQEKAKSGVCADLSGTLATHRFRQLGETIEISIRGDGVPAGVADCEPVSLELHWANGRNHGSNFSVTFRDGNNRPIYAKQFSGFMTGVLHLPLSSFDGQPVYGSSLAMISVPTTVTIQTVRPFAAPASLSYTVTRVARETGADGERRSPRGLLEGRGRRQDGLHGLLESGSTTHEEEGRRANEIVSIHSAVRLIGASRLQVVQIELKTSRPFPVKDVPLQLQIGNKVFVDELSGDYTGRRLTLSLTPEMFAELKDGDEIVAFFSKPLAEGDAWNFGKLIKSRRQEAGGRRQEQ